MPKINWIEWNGTRSTSFGIFVSGNRSFDAAESDVTAYQIPGRNGDLIVSNKRYKNIEVTYPAFVPSDFDTRVQSIRNWMRSSTGYEKLEDSFDTTHFRMARPKGVLKFSPVVENIAANLSLVFDCKPQRFLNSGFNYELWRAGIDDVTNPTQFDAYPIFYVYTQTARVNTLTFTNDIAGTFTMTIDLTNGGGDDWPPDGIIYFDCETRNIYRHLSTGNYSYNEYVTGDWPEFPAGSTTTLATSGLLLPDIFDFCGRWWEL